MDAREQPAVAPFDVRRGRGVNAPRRTTPSDFEREQRRARPRPAASAERRAKRARPSTGPRIAMRPRSSSTSAVVTRPRSRGAAAAARRWRARIVECRGSAAISSGRRSAATHSALAVQAARRRARRAARPRQRRRASRASAASRGRLRGGEEPGRHQRVVQLVGVARIGPRLRDDAVDRARVERAELAAARGSVARRVCTACARRSSSGASSRNA